MAVDPILLCSSSLFVIPMTYAAYHECWYIYASFALLLVTSVAFHSSKNEIIMRIDQASIVHIVIVSIIAGYQLDRMWVAVVGTGWAIYVYCYGYMKNTMAFSPSYIESRIYHATTHLVISGGWIYGVSLIRSLEAAMKEAMPSIEAS